MEKQESRMSDIIKASLDGVRGFTDMDTVIGNAIHTPSGVTVIPVSKLTVGFAGGGVDFTNKKGISTQNFGSGSGSGVSITPIAFLTVNKDAQVNLIHINPSSESGVDRIVSLVENSPELIQKIKNSFSG